MSFDAQGDVELAAEVLEGDGGGELDQLRFGEVAAGVGEQLVRDLLAGDGHGLRKGERHALGRRVVRARRVGGDVAELVLGGAFPQTAG